MKCKKLLAGLLSAAMVFGSVSFTAFADSNDELTYGEFLQKMQDNNYNYDFDGATIKITTDMFCTNTDPNHDEICGGYTNYRDKISEAPARIQDTNAQYQPFEGITESITIKNAKFVADKTKGVGLHKTNNNGWQGEIKAGTEFNVEFQFTNSGNLTIEDCSFDGINVAPYHKGGNTAADTVDTFKNNSFKNVYNAYGIQGARGQTVVATGNEFEKCNGGIYIEGAKEAVTIEGNTFSNMGKYCLAEKVDKRGCIQISAGVSMANNSDIVIVNNTFDGSTPELCNKNKNVTKIVASGNVFNGANNDFTSTTDDDGNSYDIPTVVSPVAKVGDNYYTDFTSAYDAANAMTEPAVIDCLADNIVTNKGRYAIKNSITINGNGATIKKSDNPNASVEFSTEELDADVFTKDIKFTVNNLNNVAVWGYRKTKATFDVTLNGCKDVDRIYITGTDGVTNIYVDDCTFTKYNSAVNDSGIYANNPGKLVVTNSTFTAVPIALNINFKAAGERNITVSDCTFIDCGVPSNTDNPKYAAPIRFVTTQPDGKINAEVANCEITNVNPSAKTHGDILLGDGRTGKNSTTNVTVKVENNNSDLKVVNEYPDETPSTSKDVPAGTSATVTNVVVANTIDLKFAQHSDEKNVYDIVLSGDGKDINRLNAAEFEFALALDTLDAKDKLTYEIKTADGLANIQPDVNKYVFYFDGKDGVTNDTGKAIKIGTVVFDGYGKFTFSATSGRATATTTADNLVTEFVVDGGTGKGTLNIKKDENKIDGNITVPTQTLTINVAMNHKVTDNAADYQDMTVEISGGDLGKDTKVFKLGTDGTKLVDGVYKIETELTQNRLYTVTVKGAGYRTARYTVNMSADKTMNFWNNVMTSDVTVVDDVNAKKNFLAGDIVKDGVINIYDLSAVVAYFGADNLPTTNKAYAKYDINRDGKIDMMDISIVLTSWGE